jgi:hypothetical protein
MWAYQFDYLDELRSFGDGPVWINPLWFWECHPNGSPRCVRPTSSWRAQRGERNPRQLTDDALFHLAWQLLSKELPA